MSHPEQCLTAQTLDAIAANRLDSTVLEDCEHHLDSCERCCRELDLVTADTVLTDLVQSCLPDDESDVRRFSCPQESADDQHDPIARLSSIFAPTDDPFRMGRLGGYEVCGVIGSGGMGIVLKVMDPALSRFVALKILSPRFWDDQAARRRFAQEAKSAASIVHDNVIEIYGVAETDGIPFFTMPYLRGDSLQRRIDQQGALPLETVLRIAIQVAAGLQAAHAQGLVHRDVKPANILLNDGASRVRITDFGIARQQQEPHLTSTGQVAGTPQYMSPEQIRGEVVDARSDLFSLGSVMYAMSAGRPPFESDSSYQLLNCVVAADPPPLEQLNPAMPTWLAAIVSRLHAADPDRRFQSAEDLKQQLTQCLKALQQPQTASPPRTVTRLEAQYRQRRRSSRRLLYGGILMTVLLAACTAAFMISARSPAPEPGPEPFAANAAVVNTVSVHGVVVDGKGKAIANTTVLAVQKTWPNNRYQQQMLTTKTNDKGEFRFDDFSQPGKQYAFLLSVVSPEHLLTSEYRFVKNGAQQKPVKLVARSMKPVTLNFVDDTGNPVAGVAVLPSKRTEKNRREHMTYGFHQIREFNLKTDAQGQLKLSAWKIGEAAEIIYMIKGAPQEFKFKVPRDRVVEVTINRPVASTGDGVPVDVKGQVVDSNGQPVPDIDVLAIRKTWPNMRYRQEALSISTDAHGHFVFDDFAPGGAQYAVLLTVVADGYAMTSEYQLMEDGAPCPPSRLQLEPAEPITFTMSDTSGEPLSNVVVAPWRRNCGRLQQLNYSMHREATAQTSDDSGRLTLTAWLAGESGSIHYWYGDDAGGLEFEVDDNRQVALTIPN